METSTVNLDRLEALARAAEPVCWWRWSEMLKKRLLTPIQPTEELAWEPAYAIDPAAVLALIAQQRALIDAITKAREEMSCANFNSAAERLAHAMEQLHG